MGDMNTKVVIIGAGPAGYALAIKLAQNGIDCVVFEKEKVGGTCLNTGCIPTKSILHNTNLINKSKNLEKFGININREEFDFSKIIQIKNLTVDKLNKSLTQLLNSYNIKIINEEVIKIEQGKVYSENCNCNCEKIVLATGTKPAQVENLKIDNKFIFNSDGILTLEQLPKSIAIIGSGAIGIEWSRIFSNLGTEVTLIEAMDKILPIADNDVSSRIERLLKKKRVKIEKGTFVERIQDKEIILSNGKALTPDIILVAIGRTPILPKTDLELKTERNHLVVDYNFMTNIENIYAIGDINGISMLAHSATHQAIELAQYFTHKKTPTFKTKAIPSVIYGEPEIAWFGEIEDKLTTSKMEYKKILFPISAIGKAHTDEVIDGFVKILVDDNDLILGASIVAPEASAMLMQLLVAKENSLSYKSILKSIFPHPTFSEAIFETLLAIDNQSLSLPKNKDQYEIT